METQLFEYTDANGVAHRYSMADKDAAMKRYVDEGCAGSIRLVEASMGPDIRERRIAAIENRAHDNTHDLTGINIDPRDVERVRQQDEALQRMGLAPMGRLFNGAGTPISARGLERWRMDRRTLVEGPSILDQAIAVERRVRAEGRVDITVEDAGDMDMLLDEGTLRLVGPTVDVRIEEQGLRALARRTGDVLPPWGYLRTLEARDIAHLWNSRGSRFAGDAMLRVRDTDDGDAAVYAITSARYAPFDANDVCEVLAGVHGGGKGRVLYDPNTTTLTWDVIEMSDVPPVEGEVYRYAHRGSSGDDGMTSIVHGGGFERLVCANMLTRPVDGGAQTRNRHIGAIADRVRMSMREAAAELADGFGVFAQETRVLRAHTVQTVSGHETAMEAIEAIMAKQPTLTAAVAKAVERDAMVEAILNNMLADEGNAGWTMHGLVQGITRFHDRAPVLVAREIEAEAGQFAARMARVLA